MIILDTHTWIWWAAESKNLASGAKQAITKADTLGVSIISCWEVAMLVSKQRIGFTIDVQDWIDQALQRPKIQLLPLDTQIVVTSTRLPGEFHGDPVDRMIVASCLKFGAPLVTKDKRIKDWRQIRVIW
jgi:PIN domain nuclease of toxin-antitoxin system